MKFNNQIFKNLTIDLDFNEYDGCTFENCKIVYNGYSATSIDNNSFINSDFVFNNAAQNTLSFLAALYHGMGAGGKDIVEATFDNIKNKKTPIFKPHH